MPKNALMGIWPAILYHSVEPYSSDGVRITIAFNMWNPAPAVPFYPGMESRGWLRTNSRGLMLIPTEVPEKARGRALIPWYQFARRPFATLRPREERQYLRPGHRPRLRECLGAEPGVARVPAQTRRPVLIDTSRQC